MRKFSLALRGGAVAGAPREKSHFFKW